MDKLKIGVVGLPGVGKTTFVDNLRAELMDRGYIFDRVSEWHSPELMEHFYSDIEKNALETEVTLLGHRCIQWKKAMNQYHHGVIFDRTVMCSSVFGLSTLGNKEGAIYLSVYNALTEKLTLPDIIIMLKAPLYVVFNRIQQRSLCHSREMESSVSLEYLKKLDQNHDVVYGCFEADNPNVPVIRLDWTNFGDIKQVASQIIGIVEK
jgi:deoxyguanosine kinase